MVEKIHHDICPVCSSAKINPLLTVKDHSVSGESFVIWQCSECALRFTQDVPAQDEIGRYYKSENYISHTNTSKGLVNSVYQRVRNYTLDQKASLITSLTKPKGTLLDLGCGTGAFLSVMKKKGWDITGIEPDADARKVAEESFGVSPLSAENFYQLPASYFDAITMWHVLEHVHDLHPYMDHLHKMLKDEGRLFIAVPNYTSTDADIYRNYWAAYDVPRHLYHFSPASIKKLADTHGFAVIEQKPMWFDSFYISLLSSKYKKRSTGYISSLINGLRSNIRAMMNKERCSSITYVLKKINARS